MVYRQLSREERHTIAALRSFGATMVCIAATLNRHRSTVHREVRRNRSTYDGFYRAAPAGEKTNGRRRRSRRNRRYGPREFAPVEVMLRQQLSPQQIVGRQTLEGTAVMSHETIYRRILEDKKGGGTLWRHLRCARKKKRKRYGRYDSRGRLAGKRPIADRPAVVGRRSRIGDWEIDTVHGRGKASVLTLVERKCGLLRMGKLPRATGAHTLCRTVQATRADRDRLYTITADNGAEFHIYKEIERQLRTRFYFATPHHAWERGTNENTNGLVRQYLPKGQNFKHLTQAKCEAIAEHLNNRPRLRLGFRTPNEVYYKRPLRSWVASCGKLIAPVLGSDPAAALKARCL